MSYTQDGYHDNLRLELSVRNQWSVSKAFKWRIMRPNPKQTHKLYIWVLCSGDGKHMWNTINRMMPHYVIAVTEETVFAHSDGVADVQVHDFRSFYHHSLNEDIRHPGT